MCPLLTEIEQKRTCADFMQRLRDCVGAIGGMSAMCPLVTEFDQKRTCADFQQRLRDYVGAIKADLRGL